MTTRTSKPGDSTKAEKPQGASQRPPSPPERHPGKKPENAGGRFEDLKIRDRGNAR